MIVAKITEDSRLISLYKRVVGQNDVLIATIRAADTPNEYIAKLQEFLPGDYTSGSAWRQELAKTYANFEVKSFISRTSNFTTVDKVERA